MSGSVQSTKRGYRRRIDCCLKGKYCSLRQFMRDKPTRFGLKFWCLASASSRYVYDVSLFEGKGTGKGPHGLGHKVCSDFMKPHSNRGHVLVCDSFFSSTRLFHDLMVEGTWACGTVRSDRQHLPRNLQQETDNDKRGRMIIRVHKDRQIACMSWHDSNVVFFLSTACDPWAPRQWALRRRKGHAGQWDVPSSPMHKLYEQYMRGVDVTDQLRASYPTLMRSHKWWHKVLSFVVDQSLVNSRICHDEVVADMGLPPLTHKKYNLRVADELVRPFVRLPPPRPPPALRRLDGSPDCLPARSSRRRQCKMCKRKQNFYCPSCDYTFLCFTKGATCFRDWHDLRGRRELP